MMSISLFMSSFCSSVKASTDDAAAPKKSPGVWDATHLWRLLRSPGWWEASHVDSSSKLDFRGSQAGSFS